MENVNTQTAVVVATSKDGAQTFNRLVLQLLHPYLDFLWGRLVACLGSRDVMLKIGLLCGREVCEIIVRRPMKELGIRDVKPHHSSKWLLIGEES